MRAVDVSKYEGGKVVADGRAIFHRWGQCYEEFEAGPGNYTTAIIERQDGTVQEVSPSLIRFIEPTQMEIRVPQ